MSRLPPRRLEELDDEGRRLWKSITEGPRGTTMSLTDAGGGLVGPFNAMLHAPIVGGRISALGEAIRFETGIDRRLLELAIVTVGARWRSNFEFLLHRDLAAAAGVPESVLDAIARGEEPVLVSGADSIVYRLTSELLDTGRVDAATFRDGVSLLGEQGIVELVSLVGYYTLVALLLNAFEVPAPHGSDPLWPA